MKSFWQRHRQHGERHSTFGASSFGASSMALLMAAPVAPATAADQAKLVVSATVLKRASLQVLSQPTAVVITEQDVARGYVDVATPAHLAVRSNSPVGYMLEFSNAGDFMSEIHVTGLATEVELSPAGGAVLQKAPAVGITRATLNLGFRFVLSTSARPGTYAWPVQLSVTPA